MARALTDRESLVLAHVVADPDAWWDHCNVAFKGDSEAALAAKVARWAGEYDKQKAKRGYKNRAALDAARAPARG